MIAKLLKWLNEASYREGWEARGRVKEERWELKWRDVVGSTDPEEVRRMLDQAHETREWPAIAPSREPTAIELAAQLGK